MGTFGKLVAFVLFVSFIVFIIFFGRLPALRRTPIGALHRALWIHIPKALVSLDQRLTSGKVTGAFAKGFDVMMHDRHPTVVIFFLLVMTVGQYLYLPSAWADLSSYFTKFTVVVAVALPYIFLYLSCATDPGYITSKTHSYYMSLYPYDYINFLPGRFCRTCDQLKPARSKHCSVCKRCVAKADHHCVFINSCVGYKNQHWFILLLVSTGLMAMYGSLLGLYLLGAGMRKRYPTWTLWPSREISFTTYLAAWGVALQRDVRLGATTLLATLVCPMIWGLCFYTLYHVYRGITTNESLKWSDWQDDMIDGYAFARRLSPQRPRDLRMDPGCRRWPVEAEQVVLATNDGEPPRVTQRELPGEGDWERIWNIRYVENLYDLGFKDNLADIFIRDYAFGSPSVDHALPVERNGRFK